ncbi:MAG: hypothetical protein V3W20_08585 [Candidatus Neomarinimicrobiota bacterium]
MGDERIIPYNPFRSVAKYLKLYLQDKLLKQVVFATPQRAYGHIVDAINDKTKKFSDWPVFSVTMTDKRLDKDQLSPVLFKLDGGIGGKRYVDGTTVVNIQWLPMTFSFQMDIWADTRNRLESYVQLVLLYLSNYPAFKIYYQEAEYDSSIGIINFESVSDTSNLDPGEDLVEFRHTATFNLMTQIPIKATIHQRIEEAIARVFMLPNIEDLDEAIEDATSRVNITYRLDDDYNFTEEMGEW